MSLVCDFTEGGCVLRPPTECEKKRQVKVQRRFRRLCKEYEINYAHPSCEEESCAASMIRMAATFDLPVSDEVLKPHERSG